MKVRTSHLLALIPAGLLIAVLAVWLWHTVSPSSDSTVPGRRILVETRTVGGVIFEIEHEPHEPVSFVPLEGRDSMAFTRGREWLDLEDGVLAVNGIAFRTPVAGDVVRWNLAGPLLINGEPQSPHPFQPRQIDAPGTDLAWVIRGGSPAPRDTLSVGWSRTGTLITAHGDGTVRTWDAANGEVTAMLSPDPPKEGQEGWGLRAAISPDARVAAITNLHDDQVTLWDVASQKQSAALAEPKGKATDVQFLSEDWLLEVRGGTLYARALPPDRGKLVPLGAVHTQFNSPFAIDAATWTVVRNEGGGIAAFRLVPLVFTLFEIPLASIENVTASGCLAIAPGGRLLALFNGERSLAFHDLATGKEIRPMRWRAGKTPILDITAMAFAPDGKTLAVADRESLRLYDVESGRERCWVSTGWVRSLVYSPDGKTLAAGLRYGSGVRLWKTADLWAKAE